jgi:hypothetical protein
MRHTERKTMGKSYWQQFTVILRRQSKPRNKFNVESYRTRLTLTLKTFSFTTEIPKNKSDNILHIYYILIYNLQFYLLSAHTTPLFIKLRSHLSETVSFYKPVFKLPSFVYVFKNVMITFHKTRNTIQAIQTYKKLSCDRLCTSLFSLGSTICSTKGYYIPKQRRTVEIKNPCWWNIFRLQLTNKYKSHAMRHTFILNVKKLTTLRKFEVISDVTYNNS